MDRKIAGVLLLLAGSGVAGCVTARDALDRGAVLSRSPGNRAIVAGPVTLRAYADLSGGEIYGAPATAGVAGAPCPPIQPGDVATPVPPDRVVTIAVSAGNVACLHTWTVRGGYELLWHAVQRPASVELAATTPPRSSP